MPGGKLYGRRWRRARAEHLRAHPLCVMCERNGKTIVATVVDHRTPHRGDPALFWDPTNWQSLCQPHHDVDKQRMERGGQARAEPEPDGWPGGQKET